MLHFSFECFAVKENQSALTVACEKQHLTLALLLIAAGAKVLATVILLLLCWSLCNCDDHQGGETAIGKLKSEDKKKAMRLALESYGINNYVLK